jgi:hypothetical protein
MPSDLLRRFDGDEDLKALLDRPDEDILVALGRPALIRIPGTGAAPRARLVSCLLHGNEDSGYRAVLAALRTGLRYPFDLWVFIGNVRAASQDGWFAHRYLDGQEDFNRVWGVAPATTRMRRCANEVLAILDEQPLEAAVDLHNNTGLNPHYAVLPKANRETLHLGALCVDTALLWHLRAHTLMEHLTPRCPSIAVECGLPGVADNAAFAGDALARVLDSGPIVEGVALPERVFEIAARVIVRPEVSFAFGGVLTEDVDFVLHPGLDSQNFGMLLAGTEVGVVAPGSAVPLCVTDMDGRDVTDHYFAVRPRGEVVAEQDFTPVMMTTTVLQAHRDCLCYVARRRR